VKEILTLTVHFVLLKRVAGHSTMKSISILVVAVVIYKTCANGSGEDCTATAPIDYTCCENKPGKCGEFEGDCDHDNHCKAGLRCGSNNCPSGLPSGFDCCFKPGRYGSRYSLIDDMILDADQVSDNPDQDYTQYRWTKGIIPYQISKQSIDEDRLDIISEAIEELNEELCIEIREANQNDTDQVNIVNGYDARCSSYVGRKGGIQELTLGHVCFTKYIIKHLFMHAIGFSHEHNRPDRGQNIEILWDHIQEENKEFFKQRNSTETFGMPFDYNSIMHYPYNAFANQSKGSTQTIKPLNEDETKYGERFRSVLATPSAHLSHLDKDKVAKMYEDQIALCKVYKNPFNHHEGYKKYSTLIEEPKYEWLDYTNEFQDLKVCVNKVLDNFVRTELWTEECSNVGEKFLDSYQQQMSSIEQVIQGDTNQKIKRIKRDVRNLTKQPFGPLDLENLDTIKYCNNVNNVPKMWFLEPINVTDKIALHICSENNTE
jgi:hypothetical protein